MLFRSDQHDVPGLRRRHLHALQTLEHQDLVDLALDRRGFGPVQDHDFLPGLDPAAVTLTYQYARSLVWLDNLTPERDPHAYDLCTIHADRTKPPAGWHLEDRRFRVHVYDAGRLAG